jgi:phosphoribosylanthranilate isomerase
MKLFQVKVCGITREVDALDATALGVDMIGFVFSDRSRRSVSPTRARGIGSELSPLMDTVGVFDTDSMVEVLKVAERCHLDWVQLHRAFSAKELGKLKSEGLKIIQAFELHAPADWSRLLDSPADLVMIDNSRGGGKRFDWRSHPRRRLSNFVLSGGLSTANIRAGVEQFRPVLVDVNSSVESSPGIKSKRKLAAFVRVCNELRYGY